MQPQLHQDVPTGVVLAAAGDAAAAAAATVT
jgi:hypothetical protein